MQAMVDTLRAHVKIDKVAIQGSIAIYNMCANSENKRLLVAAGAQAVLRAIEADRASSAQAKSEARDALERLT